MDINAIGRLVSEPEYGSIRDFLDFCRDDDRTYFTHLELRALAYNCRLSGSKIRTQLESAGLTLAERAPERRIRGFTANNHDRWYGAGSSPSHGGSGWEQIQGFAGRKG
jgi:hypothetical protein